MDQILYKVPVPQLASMTEEQRCKAIEDYMRESQRQLRMILADLYLQAEAAQRTADAAIEAITEEET